MQAKQERQRTLSRTLDSLDIGVRDVKEARAGRKILDTLYRHTPARNAQAESS